MAKRAVACRFLTEFSDGRGKDGYYRRLAGMDEESNNEDDLTQRLYHDVGTKGNDRDVVSMFFYYSWSVHKIFRKRLVLMMS